MVKPVPAQRKPRKNNPWEVLFQREPIIAFQQSFRWLPSGAIAMSPHGAHVFGVLAIAVALVVVWFYFRLRGQIRRDENAGIRYPE